MTEDNPADADAAPPDGNAGKRGSAPTIRDVARLAAVSIGTASKALNASGVLRQETRDKVVRVARELGYRPNDMAQSLHRSKSMTVGILSTDSFGRFTFPIFQALEERLADQGIAVFMCNATDDPARERQHIDQLLGKRVDGIVGDRPPFRPPAAGRGQQPAHPDHLRVFADRRPGRVLPAAPTTRAAPGSPSSI